jgi:hypothetical protein
MPVLFHSECSSALHMQQEEVMGKRSAPAVVCAVPGAACSTTLVCGVAGGQHPAPPLDHCLLG